MWQLALSQFAVSTSGSSDRSIDDRTCTRTSGQEGSVSYCWANLLSRALLETTKIFAGKVCVKWKDTWVWATMIPPKRKFYSARRCKQPSTTVAQLSGRLSSSIREVDKHSRKCWFTFFAELYWNHGRLRITSIETTFLPVNLTAESQHASIERNKGALQVKCSWKRNLPKVNTADNNIVYYTCCIQNCLSLFANEEFSADIQLFLVVFFSSCFIEKRKRKKELVIISLMMFVFWHGVCCPQR